MIGFVVYIIDEDNNEKYSSWVCNQHNKEDAIIEALNYAPTNIVWLYNSGDLIAHVERRDYQNK